jgi:hypothetical protein
VVKHRQYVSHHGGRGGVGGRGSPHQQAQQEMQLEMIGWLICPNACPGISNDLTEFDGSYMMPYPKDVHERRP